MTKNEDWVQIGNGIFATNPSARGNRIAQKPLGRFLRRLWHVIFRHGVQVEAHESRLWIRCHCGARLQADVTDANIFPPWTEDTHRKVQVSHGYITETLDDGSTLR